MASYANARRQKKKLNTDKLNPTVLEVSNLCKWGCFLRKDHSSGAHSAAKLCLYKCRENREALVDLAGIILASVEGSIPVLLIPLRR